MPIVDATDADREFMRHALAQAQKAFDEGGLPVGAVLVRDGEIIAAGRNRSRQSHDPTSHGEIDCLRNGGLLEAGYAGTTLYSTLSPCLMCAGAVLFFGVPRVVIGDRETYPGDVEYMSGRGVEIVLLDDPDCRALMKRFVREQSTFWNSIVAGDALR